MAVSPQRFPDVTSASVLCPQLYRFEPVDVASVEEHESDDGRTLVDFERVACQSNYNIFVFVVLRPFWTSYKKL
jgi:hypothetical protein